MSDFVNTSPFFIHDTSPGTLEDWHLPHMGNAPNDAEIESCVIAGARMGGGMQEVSQPMPLEHHSLFGWLAHYVKKWCRLM